LAIGLARNEASAGAATARAGDGGVVEQRDVPLQVHAIGAVEAYATLSVKTQITGE